MLYNKYVIRIILFILFLLVVTLSNFNYLKIVYFYNKELNTAILLLILFRGFTVFKEYLSNEERTR